MATSTGEVRNLVDAANAALDRGQGVNLIISGSQTVVRGVTKLAIRGDGLIEIALADAASLIVSPGALVGFYAFTSE